MASLERLPNWEKSQERWEAWWEQEIIDRPLIQVYAKANRPYNDTPPPPEVSVEDYWLNADWRIDRFEHEMANTAYYGEAFPYFDPQIGPGTMALYLGSEPTFSWETVWYGHTVSDIPSAVPPRFDPANKYWQISLEMARKGVERFKGRALVSYPDLVEGLDIIASLFGTNELLFALVEYPEKVHEFQRAITDLYFEYFDRLYEIIKDEDGGSCFSAFRVYGKGKVAKVQCDFSAMISPAMFEEFVIPYLTEQCRRLGHAVYHLDGECCIQHLDLLCNINELEAIQWTPGPSPYGVGNKYWYPMYKKIIGAGKSLMLNGVSGAEAEELVKELGPEGLDLCIWSASEEEAEDIVKRSYSWTKR